MSSRNILKKDSHAKLSHQVISATKKTEKEQIRLENNTIAFESGAQEPIPNGFYTRVSACDQGNMEGAWDNHDCLDCYENRVQETHEPGAKASYKW